MAHPTRYRNRRIIDSWVKVGALAKDYIDDIRFGRTPEQSPKGLHFTMLYDLLNAYESQAGCQISPFNIFVGGKALSVGLNVVSIDNAKTVEDENCPCDTNCLTRDQINTLEEKIIQITQTYNL